MREKIVFTPEVDVPMINSAVDSFMAQLRVLIDDILQVEEAAIGAMNSDQVRHGMLQDVVMRSDRLVSSGHDMSRRISQVIEHAAVGSGPIISLIARLAVLEDGVNQLEARKNRLRIR